jgi:mono/diheme cytochrome c family protein
MKRQLAVQAFELNPYVPDGQGLTPPEGTVAVGNPYPDLTAMSIEEQEALQNPVAPNLASLKRGEEVYNQTCVTCHGADGGGNGPVAGPPFGQGPFGMVLPIGGQMSVARGLSDGHIYTTITLGRNRMPSYRRLLPEDRWNVINYVRDLNGQGGRQ